MKKFFSLLFVLATMFFMSSCVSTKKIVYFQGSEEMFQQAQSIIQQYEMRLKPADQVMIKITCPEPDLLNAFAQNVIIGSFGGSRNTNTNMGSSLNGSMTNAYGFTITNEGNLNLPAVGKVSVAGLTTEEAAKVIEQKIKEANLVKEPEVMVSLLNARVAVLGAVRSPQVVSLTSERNTVLDVLSKCGDLSDVSLRQKVRLYRESDGVRKMYELDLTKADIFNNPAFYVQQNDLIYVEPNKSQTIKSSAFYTFWSAGASIISVLATLTSMIFLIKRG